MAALHALEYLDLRGNRNLANIDAGIRGITSLTEVDFSEVRLR